MRSHVKHWCGVPLPPAVPIAPIEEIVPFVAVESIPDQLEPAAVA